MTDKERAFLRKTAFDCASRHGAVCTALMLKQAENPDSYVTRATNYVTDKYNRLTSSLEPYVGPGLSNYASTGILSGLGGGMFGLLREATSGKKKKNYLSAFLKHSLLSGALGMVGRGLYNNYHGISNGIVSDANRAGAGEYVGNTAVGANAVDYDPNKSTESARV